MNTQNSSAATSVDTYVHNEATGLILSTQRDASLDALLGLPSDTCEAELDAIFSHLGDFVSSWSPDVPSMFTQVCHFGNMCMSWWTTVRDERHVVTPPCLLVSEGADAGKLHDSHLYYPSFCMCNKDLVAGLTSPAGPAYHYCQVWIPRRCRRCSPVTFSYLTASYSVQELVFPDDYELKEVQISHEHYWFYSGSTIAKQCVPKRNAALAINGSIEGSASHTFGRKDDVLLHFWGCLARLQDTRIEVSQTVTARVARCIEDMCLSQCLCFGFACVSPTWLVSALGKAAAFVTIPALSGFMAWWAAGTLLSLPITAMYHRVRVSALLNDRVGPQTHGFWATKWTMSKDISELAVTDAKASGSAPDSTKPPANAPSAMNAAHVRQEAEVKELGAVPTRVAVNYKLEDLQQIGKPPRFVRPAAESRELLKMEWSPKWGLYEVRGTMERTAYRVGPILGAACVYNNKDVITRTAAAAARLIVKDWVYKPSDELRQRLKVYSESAKRCLFTKNNVERALRKTPMWEALGNAKLNQDRFLELVEDMAMSHDLEFIKAELKFEVTAKPGKAPRIIMNEGLRRTVANVLVVSVFESIVFDHFHRCSIKHQGKDDMADRVSHWFSQAPNGRKMCGVEVDQTAFDIHERAFQRSDGTGLDGLCADEVDIFEHIYTLIGRVRLPNPDVTEGVIEEMRKGKTNVEFQAKGEARRARWKAILLFWLRKSGWRGTSGFNFWKEKQATLCVMTKNPQKIFTSGPLDSFDFVFTGLDGKPMFLKPILEGDDFAGHAERRIMEFKTQIEEGYTSLGLEAKLKFVVGTAEKPARLEFVGLHFLMIDGLTVPRLWVPDVFRGLVTSGVSVTSSPDVAGTVCGAFWMRAVMCAGRCDPMGAYYAALAGEWAARAGVPTSITGHDVEALFKTPTINTDTLAEMYNYRFTNPALTTRHQLDLLKASLECDITAHEMAVWASAAHTVTVETEAADVYPMLPQGIRTKLLASFRA